MKKFNKRLTLILLAVVLAFAVSMAMGCSDRSGAAQAEESSSESSGEPKVVKLAYGNWAETIAFTNMVEIILEEMGYSVEKTMAEVALQYSSVAGSNSDIMVETWMPVTQKAYWDKFHKDFDVLGTWFDQAKIGLVAPSYLEVDSIDQLNSIKDKLNGEIVGIDAGAGIMKNTETAIESYNLDLKLLSSSGPAMTSSLKKAIDNKDSIVVTGWAPHWKFARWDLKFLEDPKGIYGGKELVRAICRKNFIMDMPRVSQLFMNIRFDMQQIGSLMDTVSNSGLGEKEAAAKWIEENRELVDSWIPAKL